VTIDFDLDDDDAVDNRGRRAADDVDEEPPPRRSPLRTILLVLLILILLCVACTFGVRNFGSALPFRIPFLSPEEVIPAQVVPGAETPSPVQPTDAGGAPAEATVVVTTEAPTAEATVEQPVTVEATEAATPAEPAPTGEGEPPAEASPTSAATAVPGPTSTPGPTVVVTVDNCDSNTPPTANANGPYTGMMGKGLAIVTFDASGSTDADGAIDSYEWDFGDGSQRETGVTVTHGYTSIGGYVVTLTVTDNCGDSGQTTVEVTITGPTPPSSSETPTPEATSEGSSTASATMGFCYVAYQCDLTAGILADVNGLTANAALTPGQNLIIPPWGQVNP
jgi:hypothetical protein